MAKKGELRWQWLQERGLNVLADRHQYAYMQSLWADPDIVRGVFCNAPAGTGKTVLAVLAGYYAVEIGDYDRIIYIRNTEVVGKPIGFLPGDGKEKVDPHMAPFISALDLVKPGTYEKMVADEKAFAISTTFERGVTYDRAFIIKDESQNFSLEEENAVHTRPTDSCKIVSIGSVLQIDDPKLRKFGGLTPFELYERHYQGHKAVSHKLVTNYRGEWSLHGDKIGETIAALNNVE